MLKIFFSDSKDIVERSWERLENQEIKGNNRAYLSVCNSQTSYIRLIDMSSLFLLFIFLSFFMLVYSRIFILFILFTGNYLTLSYM